ncbi:MAG TPA: DnaJ C-terminal domain-containing protein, partial [Myxococcota bacterium]|nr:DnaJ C-terminal domain-containing protein [Myxococcota bacterium]
AYQRWSHGRQATGQPFESEVVDFDLGDVFGDFFGGTGGGGGRRQRAGRGADLAAVVEIDLGQALRGTEVQLEIPNQATCGVCRGSGVESGGASQTCTDCRGAGTVQAVQGPVSLRTRCPSCAGTGKKGPRCGHCHGSGREPGSDTVTIRIPPGADNGSKLRVSGRGAPGSGGAAAGDLVIETRVRPHPFFRREGLDLHLKLPVTLDEAYNGATVEVPTPTGAVNLRIPPRSQQGARLRLRGKGVKRSEQSGDLYVELDARLPDADDANVAEAVRVVSRAYVRPVRQEVRL